jgi:hypothetical protein
MVNACMFPIQLFRRVAAALPGMDSSENKQAEGESKYKHSITFFIWMRELCTETASKYFNNSDSHSVLHSYIAFSKWTE